jgi:hypothetical protein
MKPDTLKYSRAPEGCPDKYVLDEDACFDWRDPPRWIFELVSRRPVFLSSGYLHAMTHDGVRYLHARLYKGWFFSVSVAPSFPRALPAACLHDWIYKFAKELAAAWGCTVRDVTHLADHWFLALMRATGFLLKRTYFCAVRMLGYTFTRLFGAAKR